MMEAQSNDAFAPVYDLDASSAVVRLEQPAVQLPSLAAKNREQHFIET